MAYTEFVTLKDVQAVLDWLLTYVSKPHPDLGRTGAICPFVKPSLDNGKLLISFSYDIDGNDAGKVKQRTYKYMEEFLKLPLANEQDRSNTALIAVFPNVSQDISEIIDIIHAQLKTEFVQKGLMLGQFHPTCPERAVRNEDFEIMKSPFPLFVMRYMSVHDILFLNQKKVWFNEYCLHFGAKYELGQISNREGFVDMFIETKDRFARVREVE